MTTTATTAAMTAATTITTTAMITTKTIIAAAKGRRGRGRRRGEGCFFDRLINRCHSFEGIEEVEDVEKDKDQRR